RPRPERPEVDLQHVRWRPHLRVHNRAPHRSDVHRNLREVLEVDLGSGRILHRSAASELKSRFRVSTNSTPSAPATSTSGAPAAGTSTSKSRPSREYSRTARGSTTASRSPTTATETASRAHPSPIRPRYS